MTASIFVGGKPIDGKLILNDDWRKVSICYYLRSVFAIDSIFTRSFQSGGGFRTHHVFP